MTVKIEYVRASNRATGVLVDFRREAWDYICSRNNGVHPTFDKVGEYSIEQPNQRFAQQGFLSKTTNKGCSSCGR